MDKSGHRAKSKGLADIAERLSAGEKAPKFLFFLIIFLYIVANFLTVITGRSNTSVVLFGIRAPVSVFTGIFSALGNVSILLLVFMYGKIGYITSVFILIVQAPMIIITIATRHTIGNISGLFINLMTGIAISIIYINNLRIEKYQKKIRKQVVTDSLTGLPSRFACTEMMGRLIKKGDQFVIVSLDLNNLKNINDTMGHELGDKVLVEIANRLKTVAESSPDDKCDFVARTGGDEFCLLLRDYETDDDILDTIRLYESEIKRKITIDGYDYFMAANFGYAEFLLDGDNESSLYSCADAALHEIKRSGGESNIMRFSSELLKTAKFLETERKIRAAIHEDSFIFYLQPQFDMNHKLCGFEALARLKNQDGTFISPVDFIPVAEEIGLIDKIDIQIFKKAACFFGQHINKKSSDLILSVNISVKHLMKNNFIEEIESVLELSGLPAENVVLEITESIMIESAEKAQQCINKIRSMGIKVAIDDFGTGYSSLGYLNKFPVNILKIDKSFIDHLGSSESSKKYVEAIISIGHILNLEVISEGVETDEQLETLKSIKCNYIQGYIWGKPLPPDEASNLLKNL